MTDAAVILAENVKLIRAQEKLNQYEFAEDCGIGLTTLSLIERGKQNVTLETLELIAARAGRTIAELLSSGLEVTYYLIETKICIEGITATTYGIGVIRDYTQICTVPDISLNRKRIEQLVYICNRLRLSPVHLPCVAEDYCIE